MLGAGIVFSWTSCIWIRSPRYSGSPKMVSLVGQLRPSINTADTAEPRITVVVLFCFFFLMNLLCVCVFFSFVVMSFKTHNGFQYFRDYLNWMAQECGKFIGSFRIFFGFWFSIKEILANKINAFSDCGWLWSSCRICWNNKYYSYLAISEWRNLVLPDL